MKRYDPEQLNNTIVSGEPLVEPTKKPLSGNTQRFTPVTSDTVSFTPIRDKPAAQASDDTMKIAVPGKMPKSSLQKKNTPDEAPTVQKKASRRHREKQPAIRIADSEPPSTPQELLKTCCSGAAFQNIRFVFLALLVMFGIAHLICSSFSPETSSFLAEKNPRLSILILLFSCLLAYDVIVRGIRDFVQLQPGTHSITVLITVLSLIHALQTFSSGEPDFCEAAALIVLMQYRTLLSERTSLRRTLETVCSFESPMGIFDTPFLLPDADSLRRDSADIPDFLQKLTQKDSPQKILSAVSSVLIPLTFVLSFLFSLRVGSDFLLSLLLSLLCTVPCAGSQSFVRSFRVLAKRLSGFGGALCGWHSAEIFGEKHTIILRDEDLFPSAAISSNGMKLLNSSDAEQIMTYALAALKIAESPLQALFSELLKGQRIRSYPITEHRIYENSGVGIEIAGDIVLVGPLSFMKSMDVRMPSGTRVRQAVYVSVNGELAGIFAVKYKPNASTRNGLRDILANRNFTVVLATRDFLITPELIAAKYELSTESIVYPVYPERLRLSELDANEANSQGALIAKDTFGAFAATVAAGRTLRITSRAALMISLFGSLLGLLVCIALLAWNVIGAVTPLHIVTFQLLWSAISAFVSYIFLKF